MHQFQCSAWIRKVGLFVISVAASLLLMQATSHAGGDKQNPIAKKSNKREQKKQKKKTKPNKKEKKKKAQQKRPSTKADVLESKKIKELTQKLVQLEKDYANTRAALMKELAEQEKEAQEAYTKARKEFIAAFRKRDQQGREKARAAQAKAQENLNAIRIFRSKVRFGRIYRPKPAPRPVPAEERLGLRLNRPSTILATQLRLGKDNGMVVYSVSSKSPAAKAGFQKHDILLQVNSKPVPNDLLKLRKMLEKMKPNTTFDIKVLRNGKQETIKGVAIPKVKTTQTSRQIRQRRAFGRAYVSPRPRNGRQPRVRVFPRSNKTSEK